MNRIWTLLFGLSVALSLAMGSAAHAAEPEGGFTIGTATATVFMADHSPGDHDQVPADADKAYPHHHSDCHGHHQLAPVANLAVALSMPGSAKLLAWYAPPLAAGLIGPDFKPPRA